VRALDAEEKRRWFWVGLGKNPVYNSRLRSVDLVAASGWGLERESFQKFDGSLKTVLEFEALLIAAG